MPDSIPRFLAMAEFEQAHSAHMANENVHFHARFLAMAEFEQAHSAHMANENVSILAANH